MKTEQFNQLQIICTLDGLCYSLDYMIEEINGDDLPEEIVEAADAVRQVLQSFRVSMETYLIAHKDIYIDKEENES